MKTHELREPVLHLCFDRYDGVFASGQRANNKCYIERINEVALLREQVADSMAELAEPYKPDLLIAVPKGGNWVDEAMGKRIGCVGLLLDKDDETKAIGYAPSTAENIGGQEAVESAKRIVVVDDLFTAFTSTNRVLALPGVAERVVAAVSILHRGHPDSRPALDIPTQSMITEHMPNILPCDSPYWQYAD